MSIQPTPLSRRVAVPLVLVAALGLAGCDTDDDAEPDTADVVEDADEAVVVDEGADVEVDDTDDLAVVQGSDEAAEALASAVDATRLDSARTTLDTAVTTAAAADGISGEGVVDDGNLQVTMDVRGPLAEAHGTFDAEAEVRLVDGVAYLRFPALIAGADVDAQWISTPADEYAIEAGELVQRALLADPNEAFALLEAPTAVAELDDDARIAGESTTHYLATVELGPASESNRLAADLFAEYAGDDDRLIEVHAYVGDDGLLRRMEARMQQDGAEVELVVDVAEVDVDVEVEAPADDDVITYDEFVAARD